MKLVSTTALAIGLALIVSACSDTGVSTVQPADAPTGEPAMPSEAPAESAAAGPSTYGVGDVVTVQQNGVDWATITVSDVTEKDKYGEFSEAAEGNTYISAKVAYEALQDGVDYNPFDWQVFVDGQAVENFAFVTDGPKPELSSGSLPTGRKAEGYVIYEVPKEGEVRMSYGNTFIDEAPIFEVVIREE